MMFTDFGKNHSWQIGYHGTKETSIFDFWNWKFY